MKDSQVELSETYVEGDHSALRVITQQFLAKDCAFQFKSVHSNLLEGTAKMGVNHRPVLPFRLYAKNLTRGTMRIN